jgi:Mn-dependent DtxR family transcriptional regulator
MELYALLLLSNGPLTTRRLSEVLAASPSQAKQIALRLAARGYAERQGSHGRTTLTDSGRELADRSAEALEQEITERVSQIEAGALAHGSSSLSSLLLSATA